MRKVRSSAAVACRARPGAGGAAAFAAASWSSASGPPAAPSQPGRTRLGSCDELLGRGTATKACAGSAPTAGTGARPATTDRQDSVPPGCPSCGRRRAPSRTTSPSAARRPVPTSQEAGVDEPDRAKTDGNLLVRVVGTACAHDLRRESCRATAGSVRPARRTRSTPEFLLVGDRVVATGVRPVGGPVDGAPLDGPAGSQSRVLVLDVSDPVRPTRVDAHGFSGTAALRPAVRRHGPAGARPRPPALRFVSPPTKARQDRGRPEPGPGAEQHPLPTGFRRSPRPARDGPSLRCQPRTRSSAAPRRRARGAASAPSRSSASTSATPDQADATAVATCPPWPTCRPTDLYVATSPSTPTWPAATGSRIVVAPERAAPAPDVHGSTSAAPRRTPGAAASAAGQRTAGRWTSTTACCGMDRVAVDRRRRRPPAPTRSSCSDHARPAGRVRPRRRARRRRADQVGALVR